MIDGAREHELGVDYVGDLLPPYPQDLNEPRAAHQGKLVRGHPYCQDAEKP